MNFLKQLWPWTKERHYHCAFEAVYLNDQGHTEEVLKGDFVMKTTGFVNAVVLRAEAAGVATEKMKEQMGKAPTNIVLWVSRVL